MDFIRVAYKENKDQSREWYPALLALDSQDLVIRGGQLVALWDEDTQLYTRRTSHFPRIIDKAFMKMLGDVPPGDVVKRVINFDNQIWNRFLNLTRTIGDVGPELDQKLIFADQIPTKEDAATFRMPYVLSDAPAPAWDELTSTLYDPEERVKFEYAIGSILSGDAATKLQKFYVFFGPPGSGKSTIMNIINWIFEGHTAAFSAYDMAKADAQFSLEPFKHNPLVAIDQDGDLSRIELNKNLNSIVSHDRVLINAKGKSLYEIIPRSTLFVGSNDPVKISNRKSGLFRRLVDIQPSGRLLEEDDYHRLMDQITFELGSIASHCLRVYSELGPHYLSGYRSTEMMYRTNDIFNFVEDNRLVLEGGVSLKMAHKMYTAWCEETDTKNVYKQFQFRDLLMDYFKEFHREIMIDGQRHRSWFMGLRELERFSWKGLAPKPPKSREWLELEPKASLFDELMAEQPAQEATVSGTPKQAWSEVTTKLKDIDTAVTHYVLVPEQHIVIDLDLTDEKGEKSLAKNLEEAALWPPTYTEVSKGGAGLHLHYDWVGDVSRLSSGVRDGVEIKTLLGHASLRRRLSLCNNLPVAKLSSGLPEKEKRVISADSKMTEQGMRKLIVRALKKDIHPHTASNVSFIKQVLDDAFDQGLDFDVSDMYDDILAFAMSSSNQRAKCLDMLMEMRFESDAPPSPRPDAEVDSPIAYFDSEVYPNLYAIGWMYDKEDGEVVKMINPSPQECEQLYETLKLIGWNNRGYDNHILYARSIGYTIEELYKLSQRIIVERDRNATFVQAYNLAYADGYDFASNDNMKSLKKWEIDLGLPHMEMDLPWDQPVPEDRIMDVMDYLENDVRSTRAVIKHIDADLRARQILAELTGLQVCNTNRQHTEKLVFPDLGYKDEAPLVYTDLREMFPGYSFDQFKPGKEKSTYRGVNVGEGGLVLAKPGMYENVVLLDVASMHPTSIVELNMFGKYTPNFKRLLDLRLAIKRGDYEMAAQLDERVAPYLGDKKQAKALSDALKIVINSVYGLTAASFPNKFRDPNNLDNIVAKRGALFMVDLIHFLEEDGYNWIHVKTDSVKVVLDEGQDADELYQKVQTFADKYGYDFEHEATYERFCLVNDAVYVCRKEGVWSATGKQFQHPVVFKTLFTGEELESKDYVEVKQVQKGAMYLRTEGTDYDQFVGRFGAFVPVLGGRMLIRKDGDKEGAVQGTKNHRWEIDEIALGSEMDVDTSYFQELVDEGKQTIEKFGSFAEFTRP